MDWISIKECLPPLSTSVLCLVKNDYDLIPVVLSREPSTDKNSPYLWFATFIVKPSSEYKIAPFMPQVPEEIITHWTPIMELSQ